MKSLLIAFLLISSSLLLAGDKSRRVGGSCESCELMFEGIPETISWETTIADKSEPGEPMEVSGIIFRRDGKTPASDIILYVYHTDAEGRYSPSANQTHGRRHGHLRGWMKTDKSGRYKFRTIRPASYPNSTASQHIHPVIKEADKNEYYIEAFLFDDDKLLTERERAGSENRGGPGILSLTKNEKGVWVGRRDIILGLNVPNYDKEK